MRSLLPVIILLMLAIHARGQATLSFSIPDCLSVGAEKVPATGEVLFFLDPTIHVLNIQPTVFEGNEFYCSIFSISGQELFKEHFTSAAAAMMVSMDVSRLSPGLYIFYFKSPTKAFSGKLSIH